MTRDLAASSPPRHQPSASIHQVAPAWAYAATGLLAQLAIHLVVTDEEVVRRLLARE